MSLSENINYNFLYTIYGVVLYDQMLHNVVKNLKLLFSDRLIVLSS